MGAEQSLVGENFSILVPTSSRETVISLSSFLSQATPTYTDVCSIDVNLLNDRDMSRPSSVLPYLNIILCYTESTNDRSQ